MVGKTVPPRSAASELAGLLDSPEIAALVSELEATRWTGRPGYPIRAMVGMALAKSIYAVPTWTKTVALAREHVALRLAIVQWGEDEDVPSAVELRRRSGVSVSAGADGGRLLGRLHLAGEGGHEQRHLAVAAQAPELTLGLEHPRRRPAQAHLA